MPVLVDFVIPETNCSAEGEIKWDDCVETTETRVTNIMTCEILHTTDCQPQTTNKCKTIEYTECFEEPTEECHRVTVEVPRQDYEHKKKCLLTEDGGGGKP